MSISKDGRDCTNWGGVRPKSGRPSTRVETECEGCGSTFIVAAKQKDARKYCSRKCYGAANSGEKNPKAKNRHPLGGTFWHRRGYCYIKVTTTKGEEWVPEHRWLVEQQIGRPLRSDETVHHRNGVKADNRLENLQLCSFSEHQKIHGEASRIGLKIMTYTGDWIHPLEGMAV